jgi:hypothetical protein
MRKWCAKPVVLLVLLCGQLSCDSDWYRIEKHSFGAYFLKEKEQQDVWRYATFLVDLDKLEIEEMPFITEKDIESFSEGEIILRREITLPEQISATGLYFLIVIDGEREVLEHFLPLSSSLSPDAATTMMMEHRIKKIRIPQHCKRLNVYLRSLYGERKYR